LLSTYALFMNNASDIFDDPLVREAFGSAIDRNAYVDVVLQGAGAPTTSWVPPGMPGYNDALGDNLSYDVEHAQDLLTEAGFEGGEGLDEVNLVLIGSDYNTTVGQFVEQQLEKNLGVDVSIEFFDQAQYFDELFAGNYDITIQSWFADWPSPDNFLNLFRTGGDANFSAYSNPDYDSLLDDAAVAGERDARLELYDQAQSLLLEDAGLAPLYYEINNTYVKPTVEDLIVTGIDGALKGDLFFWKTKIVKADGD
jgi:oligopeptide transport system substrate-binding protein